MEDQYDRCFYTLRAVAMTLHGRALESPLGRKDQVSIARVLLDWHHEGGGEFPDHLGTAHMMCEDEEARRPRKAA